MSTKDLRILYRGVELPNRRQVNDIDFHADARAAGDSSSGGFPQMKKKSAKELAVFGLHSLLPKGDTASRKLLEAADPNAVVRPLLHYSFRKPNTAGNEVGKLKGVGKDISYDEHTMALMEKINVSFKASIKPVRSEEGTGGTYFIRDQYGQTLCVFKPRDEEAFAANNPKEFKGYEGHPAFREGLFAGDGAPREMAAYLLDQSAGFHARVPLTTMVEAFHPAFSNPDTGVIWKEGAMQSYVEAKSTVEAFVERNALDVFSVDDVHRIGILDIRLCNLDRNEQNILVQTQQHSLDFNPWLANRENAAARKRRMEARGGRDGRGDEAKYRLVPIDHGLCLPDWPDVCDLDLVWFTWDQAQVPFSRVNLKRIFSLNFEFDAARLKRKLLIRDASLRTLRACTLLLITGARRHLTLYQIAEMMCRKRVETPSQFELLLRRAILQAAVAFSSRHLMKMPVGAARNLGMDLHVPATDVNAVKFHQQISSRHGGSRSPSSKSSASEKRRRATESVGGREDIRELKATVSASRRGRQSLSALDPVPEVGEEAEFDSGGVGGPGGGRGGRGVSPQQQHRGGGREKGLPPLPHAKSTVERGTREGRGDERRDSHSRPRSAGDGRDRRRDRDDDRQRERERGRRGDSSYSSYSSSHDHSRSRGPGRSGDRRRGRRGSSRSWSRSRSRSRGGGSSRSRSRSEDFSSAEESHRPGGRGGGGRGRMRQRSDSGSRLRSRSRSRGSSRRSRSRSRSPRSPRSFSSFDERSVGSGSRDRDRERYGGRGAVSRGREREGNRRRGSRSRSRTPSSDGSRPRLIDRRSRSRGSDCSPSDYSSGSSRRSRRGRDRDRGRGRRGSRSVDRERDRERDRDRGGRDRENSSKRGEGGGGTQRHSHRDPTGVALEDLARLARVPELGLPGSPPVDDSCCDQGNRRRPSDDNEEEESADGWSESDDDFEESESDSEDGSDGEGAGKSKFWRVSPMDPPALPQPEPPPAPAAAASSDAAKPNEGRKLPPTASRPEYGKVKKTVRRGRRRKRRDRDFWYIYEGEEPDMSAAMSGSLFGSAGKGSSKRATDDMDEKRVPEEWTPEFERLFLIALESLVKSWIDVTHKNWRNYEWHGPKKAAAGRAPPHTPQPPGHARKTAPGEGGVAMGKVSAKSHKEIWTEEGASQARGSSLAGIQRFAPSQQQQQQPTSKEKESRGNASREGKGGIGVKGGDWGGDSSGVERERERERDAERARKEKNSRHPAQTQGGAGDRRVNGGSAAPPPGGRRS
uniref:PI3K/PI4K catalytic domain-containing protein n=1 Tax=Chromera velia CCMP2878 TaxID=1169474 RepID=A0A0G4FS75_9ALVE|eukprot:Cvel_18347.t1-p1 / transcript=Cvel_18347.t1 / gene=Cvel_18347 / organism=Chromera_velia_CCMP2878 / gene_product=Probable phosphatidylinositol 4-kinase type 2-beta, putative / transcript_product=Probable phosphatidylinositol 4-kinase type 2-beta, putative / location=Cvel_scaffold1516:246-9921(+) / protein_length=1262 / sequence_SO=supercontig / SO=protein_coding / is_pseudo=false